MVQILKCRVGFTLLEILVVLVVFVLIASVAVTRVGKTYRVEARQLASRMISTVKYLYDKAATEDRTVRLVFDFENSTYWAESTSERFLLEERGAADSKKDKSKKDKSKGGEKEKEKVKEEAKKEEAGAEAKKEGEGEADEEKPLKPAAPVFGPMDEPILGTERIPPSIYLKDIYTSHDEGPVGGGKAYIYFFPNGSVEAAVINFKNEDDTKNFSIKINPITGDSDAENTYRTLEDDEASKK